MLDEILSVKMSGGSTKSFRNPSEETMNPPETMKLTPWLGIHCVVIIQNLFLTPPPIHFIHLFSSTMNKLQARRLANYGLLQPLMQQSEGPLVMPTQDRWSHPLGPMPQETDSLHITKVAAKLVPIQGDSSSEEDSVRIISKLPLVPCRVCGKKLTGCSNRRKHEKRIHPDFEPKPRVSKAKAINNSPVKSHGDVSKETTLDKMPVVERIDTSASSIDLLAILAADRMDTESIESTSPINGANQSPPTAATSSNVNLLGLDYDSVSDSDSDIEIIDAPAKVAPVSSKYPIEDEEVPSESSDADAPVVSTPLRASGIILERLPHLHGRPIQTMTSPSLSKSKLSGLPPMLPQEKVARNISSLLEMVDSPTHDPHRRTSQGSSCETGIANESHQGESSLHFRHTL